MMKMKKNRGGVDIEMIRYLNLNKIYITEISLFKIKEKMIQLILSIRELKFCFSLPVPDKFYEYDYNNEGLDQSVCGSELFLEFGE